MTPRGPPPPPRPTASAPAPGCPPPPPPPRPRAAPAAAANGVRAVRGVLAPPAPARTTFTPGNGHGHMPGNGHGHMPGRSGTGSGVQLPDPPPGAGTVFGGLAGRAAERPDRPAG